MDKNKHGQLPLTHAFERIATALEAKVNNTVFSPDDRRTALRTAITVLATTIERLREAAKGNPAVADDLTDMNHAVNVYQWPTRSPSNACSIAFL
ncbi:MAG TPA: hypothetical protein VE957_02040 [Terriglobales bacterium]|nr:hypothetical protein [Terriglobales bacterium]